MAKEIWTKGGRHIYAYYHVRTNQVVYSFTSQLKGRRALAQLPDAGANNKPSKLRKDLWRPLWTLSLPETENTEQHGLHIFTKLRQWRILHELNWSPPALLHRLHTANEIDELKEKLERRGGSKKESVFDVIKHDKRKIRARAVMNQKANSIADLAAVLTEQEEVEVLATSLAREKAAEQEEIEALAGEEDAALLEKDIERTGSLTTSGNDDRASSITPARSSTQVDSDVMQAGSILTKKNVAQGEMPLSVQSREGIPATELVQSKMLSLKERRHLINGLATALKQQLKSVNQPRVFPVDGVRIAWSNVLDAEYAQVWPSAVSHRPMGFTRYTARDPTTEAYLDAAEFRSARSRWQESPSSERERKQGSIRTDVVARVKDALVSRYALSKEVLAKLSLVEDRKTRTMKRLRKVLQQSDV